ncbi:MAG: PEP-CTERM sorting domain-containing protein [Pseudomonadota bacterium]
MPRLAKGLMAALLLLLVLTAQTARADSYIISDLVSNTNVMVSNQIAGTFSGNFGVFTSWTNAVITPTNPAWTQDVEFMTGAHWITSGEPGLNYAGDTYMDFRLTVTLPSLLAGAAIDPLVFSADNAVQVYLNGSLLGTLDPRSTGGSDPAAYGSLHTLVLTYMASSGATLQAGLNQFDFVTQNYVQSGGTSSSNPTAVAFSSATPEPGSMLLLGSAAGLLCTRRRRQIIARVKSWRKAA